ncbi:MAG TPA: hypothetical protein VHT51_16575 [Micropepsaceae bacterium]|nr:hypothetical protein [Micropepsaceae bacterium]
MKRREFLLLAILAAAAPAVGQTQTQAAGPDGSSVPDFTRFWRHQSLPGLEPLASGPTSLTNRSRRNGVSNYNELVGDYTNPILKPNAAEIVKKKGELSLAGVTYPSPANQCWPEPVPFIFKNFGMMMIQRPQEVTILYDEGPDIRHVRMNQSHPAKLTPSWYGDSVGHYEGDTLVIDTVGTRTDSPFAMLDLYGTPYTKALHVVERYRLVDYEAAQDGLRRDAKENQRVPGDLDPNYRGKFLQVTFTVEDEGVFTMPWTATITYRPARDPWQEVVCAENTHEYYYNKESEVPTAAKPDF